ncbi:MAG: L7Ae/L30e/S12e/Gadd45 family ribosomal protein [Catonella sp.]|uniref:L7Ae/L30e/S12e/Gadd45 family ribosomal protein n=1 Tax=Catonella sp. TaxID=2382125 RepID=UPI003FA08139
MDKVLSYLGLAKKAGKLATGEFLTENAIYAKKTFLVIIAEDASDNTKKKFTDRCTHHKVPIKFYGTKEELGNATGAAIKASMAVLDEGFSKAILNILN